MTIERLTDAQAMELLEKRRKRLETSLKILINKSASIDAERRGVEKEIELVDRAMDLFLRNGAAQ